MKVDIRELRRKNEKTLDGRLKFIDDYVEWLKKTPSKVWSKQQVEFLG